MLDKPTVKAMKEEAIARSKAPWADGVGYFSRRIACDGSVEVRAQGSDIAGYKFTWYLNGKRSSLIAAQVHIKNVNLYVDGEP